MKVTSGSWQGTAVAGLHVDLTGGDPALFGKRPLAIWCKGTANRGWLKTATMPAPNDYKELSGTFAIGAQASSILSYWTRGIVVGTNTETNNGATIYHWFAIWDDGSNDAAAVSYVGNGAVQTIEVGFQPDLVIVAAAGARNPYLWATGMGASSKPLNALAFGTLRITGVTSTGFTIGTSVDVSTNGEAMHALALKAGAAFSLMTWTGNGVADTAAGALSWQPDAVMCVGNNAQSPCFRARESYGDWSGITSGASFATNQIKSVTPTGIMLGSSVIVNESAIAFYGLAFKDTRPLATRRAFLRGPSLFRRPFNAASAWNTPISASATVDANNADMIRNLKEGMTVSTPAYFDVGGCDQNPDYGVPVYRVDASTPRRTIVPDSQNYWSGSAQVPVPQGATAAAGTDGHFIAYDRDTDTLHECWQLDLAANEAGFYISFSARGKGYNGPLGDDGLTPDTSPAGGHGSARAYGGSLLAGAIRYDELFDAVEDARAGDIHPLRHALCFAIRNVSDTYSQSGTRYVGPRYGHTACGLGADGVTESIGVHESGNTNTANAYNPPIGARLRLAASVDVPTLAAGNWTTHVLGLTLQQYGAYLVDGSGATNIFVELPRSGWGGLLPRNALAALSPAASADTMFEWLSLPAVLVDVR